jgi:hypothetical protein
MREKYYFFTTITADVVQDIEYPSFCRNSFREQIGPSQSESQMRPGVAATVNQVTKKRRGFARDVIVRHTK